MDREDEEIIERWFLSRNIGSGTQKTYLISLRDYSELIGKTPYELYLEADEEADAGVRPIKSKAFTYLLKYKKHLMESGKALKTIKLYFSAIRSFYKSFEIPLPDIKFDTGDIGLEKNIGRPLTRDDIRKLANAASSRERAIIYLMALSGMSQQEARDLTIKKYIEAASSAIERPLDDVQDLFKFEQDILKEILTIHITRRKVRYRYITFIPPEASREIINYLKERCYGRNENIRITDHNDYIFASQDGGQMSRDSVITNFRRAGELAGFKREEGAYSPWRSHALRKYFISTIINKKGNKIIADFMAGHKISDQDRTYWQANPEDLKKLYYDVLPDLSLDEANVRDYETKEYREIKQENQEIKEENALLIAEIKKINGRVESIEEDREIEVKVKDLYSIWDNLDKKFKSLTTGENGLDEQLALDMLNEAGFKKLIELSQKNEEK